MCTQNEKGGGGEREKTKTDMELGEGEHPKEDRKSLLKAM